MKKLFNLKRRPSKDTIDTEQRLSFENPVLIYNLDTFEMILEHLRAQYTPQEMIKNLRQKGKGIEACFVAVSGETVNENDIPYEAYTVMITSAKVQVQLDDRCAKNRNLIDRSTSKAYFKEGFFPTYSNIKYLCDVKGPTACLAQYFLDQDNLFSFTELLMKVVPDNTLNKGYIQTQIDYMCSIMTPGEINKMFGKAYSDYDRKLWDYMLYPTYLGTPTEPPRPKKRPDRAVLDLMMIAFNTKMNELTATENKVKSWTP